MPRRGPTSHLGCLVAASDARATSRAGAPVPVAAHLHQLVLRDHGTGLGSGVMRLISVDDRAASTIAAGHERQTGHDLQVDLSTGADPALVEVASAWGTRTWHRPVDVADGVLAQITRHLLDVDRGGARLHGGAVVDARDQAVVVLGSSGAGKSTLIAHLAAGGRARVISDEQVTLFADEGMVGGFTRPIAIKREGIGHVPRAASAAIASRPPGAVVELLLPTELGTSHTLAGRTALIVIPDRHDAPGPPTWEALPPLAAVEQLAANNLDLAARPAATLESFARLAARTPVIRLRYQHAADAVRVIDQVLEDLPDPGEPCWSIRAHDDEEWPGGRADAPHVARSPDVLTLTFGEEAVLLHVPTLGLARLNAAGASLWGSMPWAKPAPGGEAIDPFVADLASKGFVRLAEVPVS